MRGGRRGGETGSGWDTGRVEVEEETAAPGAGHGSVWPCLVSLMVGGILHLLPGPALAGVPGEASCTTSHRPAPPSMDGAASPLRGAGTSRGAGCQGGLSVPGVLAGKSSLLPAWEVLPCVVCLAWGAQGSPVPGVPGEARSCCAVGYIAASPSVTGAASLPLLCPPRAAALCPAAEGEEAACSTSLLLL